MAVAINYPGTIVKYIGVTSSYADPVAGTGTWTTGEQRTLDDDIAQVLLSNYMNFQYVSDNQVVTATNDPVTGKVRFSLPALMAMLQGVSNPPNTCAFVGDSITANNYSLVGPVAWNPAEAVAKVSNTPSRGWFNWLNILSGGSFNPVYMAAVAGKRTDEVLASQITPAINSGAGFVFEQGGTNDISQLSSFFAGNAANCENAIVTNRLAIWTALTNATAFVIAFGITPVTSGAAWSAAQVGIVSRANRRLRDAARSFPGVQWVDAASPLVDTASASGLAKTGVMFDPLHPSNSGAYLLGKELWNRLQYFVKRYTGLICSQLDCIQNDSSSKQLIPGADALLVSATGAAAGTGMSGTQVTALTIGRIAGTGTAVASVVPSPDGVGNAQQLVCTFAAAEDDFRILFAPVLNISQVPAGTPVYFEFEVTISGVTNSALRCIYAQCATYFSGGASSSPQTSFGMNQSAGDAGVPDASWSGVIRTPVAYVPSDATGVTGIRGQIDIISAGAGSATVQISRASLVKAV